ncbi:hypothetical protein KIH86_27470 [Paenibacillus sp. HN-1]|uniref:DUF6744 family protein n=1 Tax=Paenibacillus TaxID=44249 RepID=UPI001CAA1932|nr:MULTISPECIES: DUF6744 family protein [Paenibacillus]MBY9079525.1 hypothetical protein [Paenibacillus sp. CGMCC 1.18879]MBY9087935.1 hypothetical protein [Paenibacillus sinensis]
MNSILKDVAAVKADNENVIGHLTWHSLSEMLITPNELKDKLVLSGLGEGWMPHEIRLPDAFRRATSDKYKQEVAPGVYENYMYREVASTNEFVQRNLVCETKDTKGRRLDYHSDAGSVVLDRKTGKVDTGFVTATAQQLVSSAAQRFEIYRQNYGATTLRTLVSNILKSMSPTPVRPSGGIYFVPKQFDSQLQSLVQFVTSLEKGEAEKIPLIDTKDMKNMITRKLHQHLQDTLRACEGGIADGMKKNELKAILYDAKRVVADFKQYESIITGDLKDMEHCVSMIREKVTTALRNMED